MRGRTGLVATLMVGLIGCTSQGPTTTSAKTRPSASELKQGLNILQSDPAWGVDGAYVKGDRVVYFESRMGAPKPSVYQESYPDEPLNEMDQRFIDQNGTSFMIQRGGDTFIDQSWDQDILEHVAHPADRALDFAMVEEMGVAMKEASLKGTLKGMEDHVYHMVNMSQSTPEHMEGAAEMAKQAEATPRPDEAYNGSCYYNYWAANAAQKCVALCIGRHSSVVAMNYSNCTSTWDEWYNACNHGTCAASSCSGGSCTSNSGMSWICSTWTNSGWVGGNKDVAGFWGREGSGSIYTVSGACSSGYNWDTPAGHECNDDSSFELWEVKQAASYGGGSTAYGDRNGFVYNYGSNGYACECNNSPSGCSGDWGYPSCY